VKPNAAAAIISFSSLLLLCLNANAQVRVSVPKDQFNRHEQIDVAIANRGSDPVSFCVEFGHWSSRDEAAPTESTPTPVYVQAHSERGWGTLLIGPDIGSGRHSVVLAAGQTQHYPFRLSRAGQMRILLDYWTGENGRSCENPPHRRTTKSKVFSVK
jgi:hypothetical protein